MKRILFFVAFPLALLFGVGVWKISENRIAVTPEKADTVKTSQEPKSEVTDNSEKEISFENVSLTYNTSLFSNVNGKIVPASLLEDPTNKPENVYSKHINFIFQKTYTGEQTAGEDYYSSPRIHVYPIEEYKKAYSFYEINLETEFNKLKKIAAKTSKISSASGNKQLPYIPFVDAHQAFYARAKTVTFQNGSGLLYLTQWQSDEIPINNGRLVYVFQGMSKDNKYFVFMEFPVSAEGLPDGDETNYPNKYEKLDYYSIHSAFVDKKFRQLYEKYAFETADKLDKLSSEKFTPSSDKIESLIRSLNVK